VNIKLSRSGNFVAIEQKRPTICQLGEHHGACGRSNIWEGEVSRRIYPGRLAFRENHFYFQEAQFIAVESRRFGKPRRPIRPTTNSRGEISPE
jgi:hypothetical protein